MKYDLLATLKFLDGTAIPDADTKAPATVQKMLVLALLNANPQKYTTPDQKYKIWKLAQYINSHEEIEFAAEEVVLLKQVVSDMYPVVVVGPIIDFLEQNNA